VIVGSQLYDLAASAGQLGHPSPPAEMLGLIDDAATGLALCAEITAAASSLEPRPLAGVPLLAPIPGPGKTCSAWAAIFSTTSPSPTVSAFTAGPPMHRLPDVVEVEDRVNWHTAQSRRGRRESHRLASRLARQRPDLYH
jgi:hypothetical protein